MLLLYNQGVKKTINRSLLDHKIYIILTNLLTIIDRLRARFLKQLFKISKLRILYQSRHLRLFVGYVCTVLAFLLIAIIRSDMLLVLGPMVYGYIHLITSYKYSSMLVSPIVVLSQKQRLILYGLLGVTFVEILLQIYRKFNPDILIPNGITGVTLSFIFLIYCYFENGLRKHLYKKIIFISLGMGIIYVSLKEPLNFVSMTLFAHNWIAFLAWFKFSKDRNNLRVAIWGFILFFLVHVLVITGVFDSYYNLFQDSFWVISGEQEVAWFLAPWSDHEIVWRRALCLYTFGLSVHYFIWIKAIPENYYKNSTPVSFRASFISFYNSYGAFLTYSIIVLSIVGMLIWFLWYEIGSLFYFTVSNMHAWTELVMLFLAFTISNQSE